VDTLMVYLDDSMIMVKRADRSEQRDVKSETEDCVPHAQLHVS
jgi:hypothetical protein